MDRRTFLQGVAVSAASLDLLEGRAALAKQTAKASARKTAVSPPVSVDGYTLVSEFSDEKNSWKAYEDLRSLDGAVVFKSSSGLAYWLPKTAEASMPEGTP